MFVDLTIEVSVAAREKAFDNERMVAFGHLGTHFDVMDKQFPLENLERPGVVFDVSGVSERDIDVQDIDISMIQTSMFVAFYTGFIEHVEYGTNEYFTTHPQLSDNLMDNLVERQISIIGIDFAGVRRGQEHTPKDQYCADRGVFIVENLCNLKSLLGDDSQRRFTAHTYPIKFADMSGLPCRVVGEMYEAQQGAALDAYGAREL
jgi:kynurenine formamidase